MKEKITTGTNDRPKHETIAQTGEGLPDDSGTVIEVDSDGVAEVHEQPDKETPIEKERRREAQEANEEMKEKFREGDADEIDDLPANRVGGIRGNPT